MSAAPELSVVVASARGAALPATIASLRESIARAGVPAELIVAWQGEPPPPALGPGVDVVRALPLGLSVNRNTGFARSRGRLVGFVDDDEVVEPGWAQAVLDVFADPRVAAAFGQVLPADARGLPHCELRIAAPQLLRSRRRAPWDIGTGGNMAFRRSTLLALGGFDARLGAGTPACSGEDADIIARLQARGAVIARWPDMVVRHPTKSRAAERASRRPYGRGMGVLARRGRSSALMVNFVSAAGWQLWHVLREGDRRRAAELADTTLGWLEGIAAADRWSAPASVLDRAPEEIRAQLPAGAVTGLPIARRGDLHLVYACGPDLMLHVRTGDPARLARAAAVQRALADVPGVPRVHAEAGDETAHWVLEERLDLQPLGPDPAAWWPLAAGWLADLARRPAGRVGDGAWWRRIAPHAAGMPAVAAALPELPAAPAHGDPRPEALGRLAGRGIGLLGWEAAEADAPAGLDLLLLAISIEPAERRFDLLSGLLDGRAPRPLPEVGVAPAALAAAALLQLAAREAAPALGMPPAPPVHGPLLERLAPRLEAALSRAA